MRVAFLGCIALVVVVFSWSARYYFQQSIKWQEKAKEAGASVRQYEVQLNVLQSQQYKLAELDEHYTEKLNGAEFPNFRISGFFSWGIYWTCYGINFSIH